jgi:SAM-dependent methyltransferase
MGKTQRELAFLRDLYIADDYTRRFTELADKHIVLKGAESLLYKNAGTGVHCFAIDEAARNKTEIIATCENQDLLNIARDKAVALKSDVDFSLASAGDKVFDVVIADASLTPPDELMGLVQESVKATRAGGRLNLFLPTAGSFGEIFSVLWEVLFNEGLDDHGRTAEKMVASIPTVSFVEEIAAEAGLGSIETFTSQEVFDYDDGAAFISSPLVEYFLMPIWLGPMTKKQVKHVTARLAELIDSEAENLSFRFSVKASLVTGKKQKGE